MSPELIGVVAFGVLLILIFLNVPVAICMIVVGFAGVAIFSGFDKALGLSAIRATTSFTGYELAVLPIFLLMGELADISGMMGTAYRSANTWLGNIRGGLAMASILGAAAFSAVSGSSSACAAIMARVALPHLLDHKYDPGLATGALVAGGTLGNLVPPGITLVIYSVITETSLGKLFIACYIPGFVLVLMYMGQIYLQCKLKPSLAPQTSSNTLKEKLLATKGMIPVAVVLVFFLGGIWSGVFTPNEGAAFGTVFVFIYALMKKTLKGRNLVQAFGSTFVTTGMAIAIIMGANIFAFFIAISNLPQALATWIMGFNLSALGLVILVMVIYFILGIVLNGLTIILLTMPILLPVLNVYHIDLIWLGVLVILQCELSNLTPPVGLTLFIVGALAAPKGIKMSTVFRGALPFCVTMIVFNVLLIAFPQIAMWLVSVMRN